MPGDRFRKGEIDHEALLPAELTGAGFVRIVQDFEVCCACVETAEPYRVRSEETLGFLHAGMRSDIHRHDDVIVDST